MLAVLYYYCCIAERHRGCIVSYDVLSERSAWRLLYVIPTMASVVLEAAVCMVGGCEWQDMWP